MNDSAVFVALIALVGVVVGNSIIGFLNQSQQRAKAKHDYIDKNVTALIDLRGELHYYQYQWWYAEANEEQKKELEKQYGKGLDALDRRAMEIDFAKAYGYMISMDIEEIRNLAEPLMENINPSLKLLNIDKALKRLGKEYAFFKPTNGSSDENWRYE